MHSSPRHSRPAPDGRRGTFAGGAVGGRGEVNLVGRRGVFCGCGAREGNVPREAEESFDEFVRSRSGALLRSAYLLTTDRHAAEDLLQDVLERVYVRWRRIRWAPEAYARRALVHQAISRWRYRRRRPEEPRSGGVD